MPTDLDYNRTEKPSLLRRGVALLVLAAAAVLVLHFIVHLVLAVFWIVLVVAAIGAVVWAANQIL